MLCLQLPQKSKGHLTPSQLPPVWVLLGVGSVRSTVLIENTTGCGLNRPANRGNWSFKGYSGRGDLCYPVWWHLSYGGIASVHWEWEELNRGTMDTTNVSAWERALPLALAPTTQCPLVSPWCPHPPHSAPKQPTQCWCSEQTSPSQWKFTHRHDPFKRHLQLQEPLSHSPTGVWTNSLHPFLPATIAGWFLFPFLVVVILFI